MNNILETGCPPHGDYGYSNIAPVNKYVGGSELSWFFRRYLLQKAMSVFKFTLPATWDSGYFLYTLFCRGYVAVINTDAFGIIPQGCGLWGYDVMYRPTNAVITNPLLQGIKNPAIGRECALVKLAPDYGGIMDLVGFYGDMMAQCAVTAGVNLVNSNLSVVFTAGNDSSAKSFAKLYDKILKGETAVVQDKNLVKSDGSNSWGCFAQNVGANYITGNVLADMRKIEFMFDTVVGIPNANTDKRERLNSDEVNANNVETSSRCELWLETIRQGFECANKLFGLELAVDWRVKPETGGVENGGKSDN